MLSDVSKHTVCEIVFQHFQLFLLWSMLGILKKIQGIVKIKGMCGIVVKNLILSYSVPNTSNRVLTAASMLWTWHFVEDIYNSALFMSYMLCTCIVKLNEFYRSCWA